MMLFRAAKETDLEAICLLAKHAGIGMTTIPNDKNFLARRLATSCASFKKKITTPTNEYYLFVLEDTQTTQIVGISAIEAYTGHQLPFYSYKISKIAQSCDSLNIHSEYKLLHLSHDNQGKSELCTLFLEPKARHNGNGLLLSRARFLFMAEHPKRFAPNVIAELRGVADEAGNSPFWSHVGQHFFHMPFAKADSLTMTTNKQFIADLLPSTPICINLLPEQAQAVIGKPHQATIPAMNILLGEGFTYNNLVDIFDAGPTIEAARDQIQTIAHSLTVTLAGLCDEKEIPNTKQYFLANKRLDFHATIGSILLDEHRQTGVIDKQIAHVLQVNPGEKLRIAPLQIPDKEVQCKTPKIPH